MRLAFHGVVGEVTTMAGCSQIAISHSVYSTDPGKGNGARANTERLLELRRLGYDYVICTVDAANVAQVAIMNKNQWRTLTQFTSRKTGNTVRIYGRDL